MSASAGPGPSAMASSSKASPTSNLWSDILSSADRQKGLGRKNVLLLGERQHGRRYLLDRLAESARKSKVRNKGSAGRRSGKKALLLGYEVLDIHDDGDEEAAPPLSVFYPPSSTESFLSLLPASLPPDSLADTAVVIVLDWTKPSAMVRELLSWLVWVEEWAGKASGSGQAEDMRDWLRSHLQHYAEPVSSTATGSLAAYGGGPLLPLGPGTLTLNRHGIPITVVCTRADLMDTVGEEVGIKGAGWEERTDWIQQAIRTLCLAYGAALFYTAPTQPHTYTLLRSYILHRLYTVPPPLDPNNDTPPSTSRFPFPHRANVLDRDAVMVPAGWDSFGKLSVLREGFDAPRVSEAWAIALRRARRGDTEAEPDDDQEDIEDLWEAMVPDTERRPKAAPNAGLTSTAEPEQTFLQRQLEILQKDPNRVDPRQQFKSAITASTSGESVNSGAGTGTGAGGAGAQGVVGPMGSGGLSLPAVEKAMSEMEGGSAEELKEKFARLGRRESTRPGPLSPGATPSTTVPNEALHNFFQGLLATKGKSSATPSKTPTPAPKSAEK